MILTDAAVRGWRTVRRYAVPAPMIHRATERRLSGDWRGACSAADVAVDLDFSEINRRFGTATAARLDEDLRHFAPDLLRWHLPRRPSTGHTALSPRRLSVLTRYNDDGPVLAVGSPRTGYGRQQLRLFLTTEPLRTSRPPNAYRRDSDHEPATWYMRVDPDLPRHVWDTRHSGDLLTWYDLSHVPGFDRAGNALVPARDDAGRIVRGLHDAGRFIRAWSEVGVDPREQRVRVNPHMALGYWYRLPEIARMVRGLGASSGSDRVEAGFRNEPYLVFDSVRSRRMSLEFESPLEDVRSPYVPLDRLGMPVDALLLHLGRLAPDDLHPLVHSAFFPSATTGPAGPPRPSPQRPAATSLPQPSSRTPHPRATPAPAPHRHRPPSSPPHPTRPVVDVARVRCGGAWHQIGWQAGHIDIPHSDQEIQREAALAVLGGAEAGCFAARTALLTGLSRDRRTPRRVDFPDPWAPPAVPAVPAAPQAPGQARRHRLPRRLRERRRELMSLALHGDTEGVVSLLDAGVSPHTRDHRGRTLLHFMAHLRDLTLLERLLAEGLDIEAADVAGVTPLVAAAYGMGGSEVIHALLAAGADLNATLERTGEPITAWLQAARPDVFASITEREDATAVTARAYDEWPGRDP